MLDRERRASSVINGGHARAHNNNIRWLQRFSLSRDLYAERRVLTVRKSQTGRDGSGEEGGVFSWTGDVAVRDQ